MPFNCSNARDLAFTVYSYSFGLKSVDLGDKVVQVVGDGIGSMIIYSNLVGV